MLCRLRMPNKIPKVIALLRRSEVGIAKQPVVAMRELRVISNHRTSKRLEAVPLDSTILALELKAV
jgi:hypothetical protein